MNELLSDILGDASVTRQLVVVVQVMWAMALGGLVGWERQLYDKPAGLRTHMLVAGAGALATAITVDIAGLTGVGDPTRGVHAVITGIGFIGAGTIMHHKGTVRAGLTTAATVFFAACVGVGVAAGYGIATTGTTLLIIAVLQLFGLSRRDRGDTDETSELPAEAAPPG